MSQAHAIDPAEPAVEGTYNGKLAMWLFLCSEVMFFSGILGAYITLRLSHPVLFEESQEKLHHHVLLAAINTILLITSSLTMALGVLHGQQKNTSKQRMFLLLTAILGTVFLVNKVYEYNTHLTHHVEFPSGQSYSTATDGNKRSLTDNEVVFENMKIEPGHSKVEVFQDGKLVLASTITSLKEHKLNFENSDYEVSSGDSYRIKDSENPSKDIFFAFYYTITGLHGFHILCGVIPIMGLWYYAKNKDVSCETEMVGLYWHFVDLVWIFLFPLLYLI